MSGVPAWAGPRTAIVTGGGSGLGEAISHRLAAEGAAVAVFDRNGDTAAATASAITAAGGTAVAMAVDVADRASIEAGVADVCERLGAPSILVNNAGISPFRKFLEISRDEFDITIAVNLRGIFDCCQVVIPHMVTARWGRIVNIASSAGQTGTALQAHYSASKAGVIGLTRALAREFGPKGITVNAVPPGFVETPGLHGALDDGFLGDSIEQHIPSIPVRRVGRPDDIAAACAFLTRDDAGYITGQVLGVNGGRVMG